MTDWEQIVNDAETFVDDDKPGVPRQEVINQLKAEGYNEKEASDMFRNAPLRMVAGDSVNPRVEVYHDADDKDTYETGSTDAKTDGADASSDGTDDGSEETESETVSQEDIKIGTIPEPWLTEDRWFVWAYDDGRKIPRAPWYKEDGHEWVDGRR